MGGKGTYTFCDELAFCCRPLCATSSRVFEVPERIYLRRKYNGRAVVLYTKIASVHFTKIVRAAVVTNSCRRMGRAECWWCCRMPSPPLPPSVYTQLGRLLSSTRDFRYGVYYRANIRPPFVGVQKEAICVASRTRRLLLNTAAAIMYGAVTVQRT